MSDLIGRIQAWWEGLQSREQVLVGAAGAVTVIFVAWFLVISPLLALGSGGGGQLDAAEQRLQMMKRVRRDYDEVQTQLAGVERRIQSKGDNSSLLTLLDSLASKSQVKIDSMEPRQAANNDKYRETKVEVSLKSVSLTQAVKYLHNIEASAQLLSVKSLRMKTRSDNATLLDVNFAVSTFEPL